MQDYVSADGVRAILLLVLAVGQAFVAYWPEIRKWDHTISGRSAALDTLVVPFGPFFAIWLIIFGSCIVFAIWHALPENLDDPYLRSVGWLAAALFAGNIAWEAYVPRYGFKWPSVFLIILELALAVALLAKLQSFVTQLYGIAYWLGAAPLYFFAGWLSVAVFASLSSTLVLCRAPLDPRQTRFAVPLIAAACLVVTTLSVWTTSWVYASSAFWGLAGIVVGAWIKKRPATSIAAAAASTASLATALVVT
ncbi:MAG: hypothetical protein AAF919_14945 [Pseudomonadota bacterium]